MGDLLTTIPDSVFLGGDFNLPGFNWSDEVLDTDGPRAYSMFADIISVFGFEQYVKKPTRENSVLDLILCNFPGVVSEVTVLPGISDHCAVVAKLSEPGTRKQAECPRKVFLYDKGNYEAIDAELESYFYTFSRLSENSDVETIWHAFRNKILELAEVYIPSKQMRKRKKNKPWFNVEIRRLIGKARRAYKTLTKSWSVQTEQKYKEINRLLKLQIKLSKKVFFDKFNENLKRNPKEFWKFVNANRKEDTSIPALKVDGNTVVSDNAKVECFNSYFKSVFSEDSPHLLSPVACRTQQSVMPSITIDMNGIVKLLRGIDATKAVGPDGISPVIFLKCSESIARYLFVIFSETLKTGMVPMDWKMANVTPVFKSGSKASVENYRPISLTSISCKLFEHIIYSNLYSFLDSLHFFSPSQHGFRSGYSCNTQLVEFYHHISRSLDSRKYVDCVFLDFRKAFDTVPHQLLLYKLALLNIDPNVLNWIQNYLEGREQRVVLNGTISTSTRVTSGVPQGSVLGPLLFLIYINDITENIQSHIKLFADDCVLYREINTSDDLAMLQTDINILSSWCNQWKMSLNLSKCKHIRFSRSKLHDSYSYLINGTVLCTVFEYVYLGVLFADSLKWNSHIERTIGKASKMFYFIRRNFRSASRNVKETLYFSLVRTILDYACVVWDPYHDFLINKLEKIQNQAARFVLNNYDPYASVTDMKAMLGWETLECRRKKIRLKFFHRVFHNKTGIDKATYLMEPSYVSTRCDNSKKVAVPTYRTDSFANSFFVKTAREWNDLPEDVVSIDDNDVFFFHLL